MRVALTAGIALVAVQEALAQTTTYNSAESASISEANASWDSASSSSISSLSSKVGPFYETYTFAPAVEEYDWVSVVGSGGPGDPAAETTTYKAYMSWAINEHWTDVNPEATTQGYANYTMGPTTFVMSRTFTEWTMSMNEYETSTLPAFDMTTRCSYNEFLPKISIPDEVWRTQDFSTLQPDNWPTRNAVCTYTGWSSLRGKVTDIDSTYTLTHDTTLTTDSSGYTQDRLWRYVTFLGESPSQKSWRTMTTSGEAGQQTGAAGAAQAGSGSGTEGAKATSTQAAGASEVTAWVNAVVVVAAAAAIAI